MAGPVRFGRVCCANCIHTGSNGARNFAVVPFGTRKQPTWTQKPEILLGASNKFAFYHPLNALFLHCDPHLPISSKYWNAALTFYGRGFGFMNRYLTALRLLP